MENIKNISYGVGTNRLTEQKPITEEIEQPIIKKQFTVIKTNKNPNFRNKVKPKTRVIDNITYYDLEQVCNRLGVVERTLKVYIYDKKIKAVKLNNKWYISETAIQEFLNGGANE